MNIQTQDTTIYRMKRNAESSFIQYVLPTQNENKWSRLFGANLATQELYPEPLFVERQPADLIQEIPQEVFAYEMALLKHEVWEQNPVMLNFLLLPQRLPDILNSITPNDRLLLYVFTEGCGVCKYLSPLISHLAHQLNDPQNNNVSILALHGYTGVLALTGVQWLQDSLGVPKLYFFTDGERKLLHNPDFLGDYNPDETYKRLVALFEK